MRIIILIYLAIIMSSTSRAQSYAIGADLSFLKQAEDNGFVFKENGEAKPGIKTMDIIGFD